MTKICRKCEKLLEQDDHVKAEVFAQFVVLKSKVVYSLSKPYACKWIEHIPCLDPKGEQYEEEVD